VKTDPGSPADGETHPHGYKVTATQPLYSGGQVLNGVRVAEAKVRSERENLRIVEMQVLLSAATAYMNVVRDRSLLRLQENNVKVLAETLRSTQERFNVGEVTRTDVAQAQASLEASKAQLETAKANLKNDAATYEQVITHPPGALTEPRPLDSLVPRSLSEGLRTGEQENPNVIIALYNEESARYAVDQLRGQLLPQISLQGSYQQRFDPSRTTESQETVLVQGLLTVPLYAAGGLDAQIRAAKHNHVSTLQKIEQSRLLVQANVQQAWANLMSARASVLSNQVQVQAAQTALTGVRAEERAGQRTLLDVLNAEQALLTAQSQLVTTRAALVVSTYALLQAVGRLSPDTLGLGVLVYDAEAHYHEVRHKAWGTTITPVGGRLGPVEEAAQVLAPIGALSSERGVSASPPGWAATIRHGGD